MMQNFIMTTDVCVVRCEWDLREEEREWCDEVCVGVVCVFCVCVFFVCVCVLYFWVWEIEREREYLVRERMKKWMDGEECR